MLFNSLEYLLFLWLAFALFWLVASHQALRTGLLLVASYVFYMSWNATFIFIIVGSTVLDYCVARALGVTESPRWRRALLLTSVLGNVGVLGLFKYFDFGAQVVRDGAGLIGVHIPAFTTGLILPVGISFYTFQTLSYTVDVYRRRLAPAKDFIAFATFVSFFPQLVAGPIVRASELLPQLARAPRLSLDDVGNAGFLITRGLAKKILIADFLAANWIDRVWDDPGAYSTVEAWLASFAYTWQLYADFSGYTDIARGSARLFGFELPENFRRPLNSTGPIDFWRKWHITLSTWIRDYIYIPLGGSRHGKARSYAALFISFLLAGIWHGAGWTYVLFGLWHGTTVALNRMARDRFPHILGREAQGIRRALFVAGNLLLFVTHWPTFRSTSIANMTEMYRQMFSFDFSGPVRVAPTVWLVLIAFPAWHMSPDSLSAALRQRFVSAPRWSQAAVMVALGALMLWVGSTQDAPFIYFQF